MAAAMAGEGMSTRNSTPASRQAAADAELDAIPEWENLSLTEIYDAMAKESGPSKSKTGWTRRLLNGVKKSKIPRFGNVANAMLNKLCAAGTRNSILSSRYPALRICVTQMQDYLGRLV